MENKAAPQELITRGTRVVVVAIVVALLASLSLAAGGAAAKRHALVGRDGKIHACYRVKGKPKGMVRVVRSKSHSCRRGERRLAWSVVGGTGQAGRTGSTGQVGGADSTTVSSKEAALETKVAGLTLQVEQLEGLVKGLTGEVNTAANLLNGVEPGDLSGMLSQVNGLEGTLEGVDNQGLKEAVAAVPVVGEVCAQTEALTTTTNESSTEFQKLLTTLSGSLLGGIFNEVGVPGPLDETPICPS